MTDLLRYAKRVAVRRLVYLLIAIALAGLGIGGARASDSHPTQSEAASHCFSVVAANVAAWCATVNFSGRAGVPINATCTIPSGQKSYQERGNCKDPAGLVSTKDYTATKLVFHSWTTSCPTGSSPDPNSGYACKNPQEICLGKNADRPKNNAEIYTGQKCVNGCVYGARSGKTGTASDGTISVIWGEVGYTGETCTGSDTAPPTNNEACFPAAGGMTMCVKPDGRHCYSANGPGAIAVTREICWNPNETGDKTDGPTHQTRRPGTNPPGTPPTPPEGETFDQGPSKTTTSTKPDGTSGTTTTTNYYTNGGTDAGPNDGQDKDEDENTSSGGGDCNTPPVGTGDPLLAQIATQAWKTRCEVEKGNKVDVSGDISDCSITYTVNGTDANAEKLRGLRASICGKGTWTDSSGEGDAEGSEGSTPTDAVIGDSSDTFTPDESGFLGGRGSCPAPVSVEVFGEVIDLKQSIVCNYMDIGASLVLLFAGLFCLRAGAPA